MRIEANWKPWLVALLVALLGLGGTVATENLLRGRMLDHERRHVLYELSSLRAHFEGVLSGNLLMVRGLSAVIAANPDIDQTAFARIAAGMVNPRHALRNIAGARDLVISLMYPMAGNESALGLDYRTHPSQSAAALRAVASGQTTLAGPLDLVQGGQGMVAREPVFLPTEEPGASSRLWGLVSAVVDIERLYSQSGLMDLIQAGELSVAIRGRDGKGAQGDVFFGDPRIFERDPELVDVTLPSGSWQIAALPTAGWRTDTVNSAIIAARVVGFIMTLLITVLTFALMRKAQTLRQTAEDLSASQRLFQVFMDNLPAGAFVKDIRTGRPLFENRWLRAHLPDGERGCGIDDDNDLAGLHHGPHLVHHAFDAGDGRRMYCDTLRFLLVDGGKHDQIGGVIMDATERIRAERELARNRARLRTLLNTIPDLVWMKDPDGIYLACNARFEAFFGANESQIVGKRDHDFVAAELAASFRKHDLAAAQADQPLVNEETVTFASDGHTEVLETIKAPVYDVDGSLTGVLGIARDISARRVAEEALRASTERLKTAETIAHIGNWEYRVSDGVITWSDETYRILGLEPGEREPDYAWLLSQIHPDDRAAHDEFLGSMLNARPGDQFAEQRFRVHRDDDRSLVISVHVKVEFDLHDKPARLFGTVQDITERDAMTRDLHDRLSELTRWQSIMLGREDRILELKREVNALLIEQGAPPRYTTGEEQA